MEKRNSFIFKESWLEALNMLHDGTAFELLRAICNYAAYDIEPKLSTDSARAIFALIRREIDENNRRYEETCSKRRRAVQTRWARTKRAKTDASVTASANPSVTASANLEVTASANLEVTASANQEVTASANPEVTASAMHTAEQSAELQTKSEKIPNDDDAVDTPVQAATAAQASQSQHVYQPPYQQVYQPQQAYQPPYQQVYQPKQAYQPPSAIPSAKWAVV